MTKNNQHLEELLTDDSFIRWIEGSAPSSEHGEWEAWLRSDPARKKLVEEAGKVHNSIRFRPSGTWETENELSKLNRSIDHFERGRHQRKIPSVLIHKRRRGYALARVAAVVALMAVVSAIALFSYQETVVHVENGLVFATTQTEYGQKKILTLSDGSTITLNANSSLKHPGQATDDRFEVWLQGEAYFDIVSEPGTVSAQRTFRVNTQDGLVEVTGTKFNVNTYRTGTEVVLEEGSVRVEIADSLASPRIEHRMTPGEWSWFSHSGESIDVRNVEVELYTSWTQDRLIFDRTQLTEIADRIEQIYGVEFPLTDPGLQQIEISGSLPNDNLPVLLDAIESILERPVIHENGTIRLE